MFDSLDWHDSVIKRIAIDRMRPGDNDIIEIDIVWPTDKFSKLVFEDVYWAKFTMGFGIVAEEAIDTAYTASSEDADLVQYIRSWNGLIDTDELKCYVIRTISTSSEIKVIAKQFKLLHGEGQ